MCVAHMAVDQAAAAAVSTLQPLPGCPPEPTRQHVRYAADALLRLVCECPALLLDDPKLIDRLAEELKTGTVGMQCLLSLCLQPGRPNLCAVCRQSRKRVLDTCTCCNVLRACNDELS